MKSTLPRVVICGRRNVGKSTLLNALVGRRRAITDDTAGLTRDLLETEVARPGYRFLLTDTPGLDLEHPDELEQTALARARKILGEADLILCILEAGPVHDFDRTLIDLLRKTKTPSLFVVNKVDGSEGEAEALTEFYEEGLQDVIGVSAHAHRNLKELLKRMAELLPTIKQKEGAPDAPRSTAISDSRGTQLRISIIGRPNAGKSSILNKLAGEDISLVSDVPGTTRDSVDTVFRFRGTVLRVVDTAGLRRSSYLRDPKRKVDFYSVRRTQRALRDCEVAIHVFDAQAGMTDQDKKIAKLILDYKKPAVLAINKWDAVAEKETQSQQEFLDRLEFLFPKAAAYPVVFCSALTGRRLPQLLEACVDLQKRLHRRIPTPRLNRFVETWNVRLRGYGTDARILYAVQADGPPPTFIFFVNNKQGFRGSYLGFFENQIRAEYDLAGVPITILLRAKNPPEK